MLYTTRLGDRPTQAHINYECPCGCTAGLTYDRDTGSEHVGTCCCGRLLWVGGSDPSGVVRQSYEKAGDYAIDLSEVTLPWGEKTIAALAVPTSWLKGTAAVPAPADDLPAKVRDVVCNMTIDPRTAAATSEYNGTTYYFCAPVCKTRFDADPQRYLTTA